MHSFLRFLSDLVRRAISFMVEKCRKQTTAEEDLKSF
jgi:hypothetical protein